MHKLYILIFFLFVVACEKQDVNSDCGTDLESSPRLQLVVEDIQQYSCMTNIYAGTYNNNAVFITNVVDPLCLTDGSVGVYDCSGTYLDNMRTGAGLQIGSLLIDNR